MSKKQFYWICFLLVVIIALQVYSISQQTALVSALLGAGNYLSGKLDDVANRVMNLYQYLG